MGKFEFTHSLPIAMWDSSWIELHYPGGPFEDWDKVIDELVERGYEAVRIDVAPHLIASDFNGDIQEVFHYDHRGAIGTSLWGRRFSLEINTRESVVEFIKKLQQRNIKIGLATWIKPVRENRNLLIGDTDDFIRIWDETLTYLDENGCLENVIFIDLLNEYPLWHGYRTFTTKYEALADDIEKQDKFYWGVATKALKVLREKWPGYRFLFSQTENYFSNRDLNKDYSLFDALDVHIWMQHNHDLVDSLPYLNEIHAMSTDIHFKEANQKLHEAYFQKEEECKQFMAEHVNRIAELGRKYHIPVGNTEGWGIIMWRDHPYLDWKLIKHAGLVSAQLAADAGYAFICSCNFCHPQHAGIWNDIEWHKKVTDIIRKGKPIY